MKKLRLFSLISTLLIATHLLAPIAAAHPLGNFTINHYAGLHLSPEAIAVDYVLDMAEIPTFQEMTSFDTDGNGHIEPAEAAAYHPAKCTALQPDLRLGVDGRAIPLHLTHSAVEFPAGAGGLATLRLSCQFQAALNLSEQSTPLTFENNVYAERLGWREIVIGGEQVALTGDLTGLTESLSHRLTSYPDDLLNNPPNQRQVSFTVAPENETQRSTTAGPTRPAAEPLLKRNDGFTQLITLQNLTLPSLLVALALAFAWGAAHALTPGHGKTIVAAYLVGSRGTVRHAVFLGLTTTVTHTAGVFLLGFLTLFASRYILPEQLYPWLGVASGGLVIAIGLSLFRGRLKELWGGAGHDHHHHVHDHHRDHHHHHHHGDGHTHSHLPPGTDDRPITWRSLLALGISGGLIPCPSALVVMLSAIALERIGFGLVLIVTFSLGLAGVLTAIGVLWVQAGPWLERLSRRVPLLERLSGRGRGLQLLPAASALFITLVGVGITQQALSQTGLLANYF